MTPTLLTLDATRNADIVIVSTDKMSHLVHRDDADPEHRFVTYRVAAAWFGNLPAGEVAQ